MISLVTGDLGAGKTFYACRKIAHALQRGKCVATNVELRPDFADFIARRSWKNKFNSSRRAAAAADIEARFFYSEDLNELMRVRLDLPKSNKIKDHEGRGIMVLDEGHDWLNARMWGDSDRKQYIRFFSRARKHGWHVYLITQDASNIDKQVRVLFTYDIRLKALHRSMVMGFGILPFKFFVAIKYWGSLKGAVIEREWYVLNWCKDLYNTFHLVGDRDLEGPPGVTLPRPSPRACASGSGAERNDECSIEGFSPSVEIVPFLEPLPVPDYSGDALLANEPKVRPLTLWHR